MFFRRAGGTHTGKGQEPGRKLAAGQRLQLVRHRADRAFQGVRDRKIGHAPAPGTHQMGVGDRARVVAVAPVHRPHDDGGAVLAEFVQAAVDRAETDAGMILLQGPEKHLRGGMRFGGGESLVDRVPLFAAVMPAGAHRHHPRFRIRLHSTTDPGCSKEKIRIILNF